MWKLSGPGPPSLARIVVNTNRPRQLGTAPWTLKLEQVTLHLKEVSHLSPVAMTLLSFLPGSTATVLWPSSPEIAGFLLVPSPLFLALVQAPNPNNFPGN